MRDRWRYLLRKDIVSDDLVKWRLVGQYHSSHGNSSPLCFLCGHCIEVSLVMVQWFQCFGLFKFSYCSFEGLGLFTCLGMQL